MNKESQETGNDYSERIQNEIEDSNHRPRRLSWASDEDLEAVQNEVEVINEQYR